MKLIVTDKALFEGIQKAFQGREAFTLTGAGMAAKLFAGNLNYFPFGHPDFSRKPAVELSFEPASVAAVKWNGEGLPPVGLEVEILWSSQCGTYVRGRVVAHDDGRAVFRFLDGERAGEYQAERVSTYNGGQFTNFRPIRTAEQIAAEAQKAEMDAMYTVVIETEPNIRAGVEALYKAGYRKVEK